MLSPHDYGRIVATYQKLSPQPNIRMAMTDDLTYNHTSFNNAYLVSPYGSLPPIPFETINSKYPITFMADHAYYDPCGLCPFSFSRRLHMATRYNLHDCASEAASAAPKEVQGATTLDVIQKAADLLRKEDPTSPCDLFLNESSFDTLLADPAFKEMDPEGFPKIPGVNGNITLGTHTIRVWMGRPGGKTQNFITSKYGLLFREMHAERHIRLQSLKILGIPHIDLGNVLVEFERDLKNAETHIWVRHFPGVVLFNTDAVVRISS